MNFYIVNWMFYSHKNFDETQSKQVSWVKSIFVFLPSAKENVYETPTFKSCCGAIHSEN